MEKIEYLVPDYFTEFSCKCGECRNSCCQGWGITVSMKEYFRLLGAECTKDMRRKLDSSLHIVDPPAGARSARPGPGWDFSCPLQAKDGLCSLQSHLGESALPSVCRLYPRAFRNTYMPEGAMSGSCERVIELLFARKEPLKFVPLRLSPESAEMPPTRQDVTREVYKLVRLFSVQLLQDRALSVPERINALSRALIDMDEHKARDSEAYLGAWDSASPADKDAAFNFALGVSGILMDSSEGFAPFFESSCKNLSLPIPNGSKPDESTLKSACERFYSAKAHFEALFPDWNTLFENILVNHIFFTDFPYSDIRDNFIDESAALTATYLVLRLFAVSYMADKDQLQDLTDVMSACFRVMEHTAYDYNACRAIIHLEKEHGIRLPEAINLL